MYFYATMALIVAASNYLVLFPINDWLTWGAFSYPVSFLVTELANRHYGPRFARKVVYVGFAVGIVLSFVLAPPKIAVASGAAFLVSQLLDIVVFNEFRQKAWWIAPLLASVLASIVDSSVFWTLGFWGEDLPLLTLAAGDTAFKIFIDFLMLTPFRLLMSRNRVVAPEVPRMTP